MTPVLFPELAEPEVARVNASAPALAPDGCALESSGFRVRAALVRQKVARSGTGSWFDWSANPYHGCELGCTATSPPGRRGRNSHHTHPKECERAIQVKADFVDALRRDVRRSVERGDHIAFGTATDPYPSIERRERVMFRALSALLDARDLRISITTKSTLVARDVKLLGLLSERHAVHVNFAITTPDARLARFLEPRAPEPEKRLDTLRALRRHGVEAGVFMMPLLPGITDAEQDVETLCAHAAAAGARWLGSHIVFLPEPTRAHFLRELRRTYPRVAARYTWWTRYTRDGARRGAGEQLPETVRQETLRRVRAVAMRHGLSARADLELPAPRRSRQCTFNFGVA